MRRHFHLISVLISAYWQTQAQYRLGSVLWIVNGLASPLIIMSIWLVVNQTQSLDLNASQITTYYLLSIIIYRLTQTWLAEDLTNSIKEGQFSHYLLKPFSFIDDFMAKDQAYRLMRLITLLPVIFIATVPAQALLGKPSVLVYLSPLIALLAFWLTRRFWFKGLKVYDSASS